MGHPSKTGTVVQYVVALVLLLALFFVIWISLKEAHTRSIETSPIIFKDSSSLYLVGDAETEFDRALKTEGLLTAEELRQELANAPPVDEKTLLENEQLINDMIRWLHLQTCTRFELEFRSSCVTSKSTERDI